MNSLFSCFARSSRDFRRTALALCGLAMPLFTYADGTIAGTVTDVTGDTNLSNVIVTVSGTEVSTRTDASGRYVLRGVPAGQREVVFSYLGFEPVTEQVEVTDGLESRLDTDLSAEVFELEALTVSGRELGTARALNAQRASDALKTVVAADALGRFPDQNVAESLQRLPGISIEKDQGEGRFASIRGIDPELSNIMIDGVSLPAPESEERAVALDVIPNDILEFVEVNKVITPDMDGDTIGGTINIRTKSAFDYGRRFGSVSLETYYNDLMERYSGKTAATYGDVIGDFGFILSASFEERHLGSDNVEADVWTDEGDFYYPKEIEFRNYEVSRQRKALGAALQFRQGNNSYYLRGLYNYFSDQEERANWLLIPDDGDVTTTAAGSGEVEDAEESERELKDRFEEQTIWSLSAGGKNLFGNFTIDYQVSFSHAEENEPDARYSVFLYEGPHAFSYDYDREGGYVPTITQTAGDDLYDGANYAWDESTSEHNYTEDEEWAARLDVRYDFELFDGPASVKFGAKYRDREKMADVNVDEFDLDDDYTLADVAGYSERYPFGTDGQGRFLRPSVSGTRDFISGWEREVVEDDSVADDYTSTEEVFAAYGMASVQFDDLTILGGVRMEQTRFSTMGNELVFDEEGDLEAVNSLQADKDYTNLLPSVSLRYDLAENLILRASVSQTISRPNFANSAIRRETNYEDEEVTIGNPELDPYESLNLDLSLEYYFEPLGAFALALFQKDVSNFVYEREIDAGIEVEGEEFTLITPLDGESALLTGVEISWQQDLGVMIDPLAGLVLFANLTFTDGNADIGDREVPFYRQSDLVYTVALSYERGPFFTRLAATSRSEYLDSIGDSADEDEIIDKNLQLDLDLEYEVMESVRIYAQIINLTNEPKKTSWGETRGARQYEEYGLAGKLGVKYTF